MTLELRAIEKVVDGEPWLTGIDLTLDRGLNILAGPTLAGKTTLMRIAAGLEPPTSGQILVDGAGRHRQVGSRPRCRVRLSGVRQLPVDDGVQQHRRAAATA